MKGCLKKQDSCNGQALKLLYARIIRHVCRKITHYDDRSDLFSIAQQLSRFGF